MVVDEAKEVRSIGPFNITKELRLEIEAHVHNRRRDGDNKYCIQAAVVEALESMLKARKN